MTPNIVAAAMIKVTTCDACIGFLLLSKLRKPCTNGFSFAHGFLQIYSYDIAKYCAARILGKQPAYNRLSLHSAFAELLFFVADFRDI
jgi:hypothetical protein